MTYGVGSNNYENKSLWENSVENARNSSKVVDNNIRILHESASSDDSDAEDSMERYYTTYEDKCNRSYERASFNKMSMIDGKDEEKKILRKLRHEVLLTRREFVKQDWQSFANVGNLDVSDPGNHKYLRLLAYHDVELRQCKDDKRIRKLAQCNWHDKDPGTMRAIRDRQTGVEARHYPSFCVIL